MSKTKCFLTVLKKICPKIDCESKTNKLTEKYQPECCQQIDFCKPDIVTKELNTAENNNVTCPEGTRIYYYSKENCPQYFDLLKRVRKEPNLQRLIVVTCDPSWNLWKHMLFRQNFIKFTGNNFFNYMVCCSISNNVKQYKNLVTGDNNIENFSRRPKEVAFAMDDFLPKFSTHS